MVKRQMQSHHGRKFGQWTSAKGTTIWRALTLRGYFVSFIEGVFWSVLESTEWAMDLKVLKLASILRKAVVLPVSLNAHIFSKGSFMKVLVKLLPVLFVVAVAGCASNSSVDEVRAMAEEAQRAAAEAKSAAAAAQRTADAANKAAVNAQSTADAAQTSANEANEKIDRAFKKAMQK